MRKPRRALKKRRGHAAACRGPQFSDFGNDLLLDL